MLYHLVNDRSVKYFGIMKREDVKHGAFGSGENK